MNDAVKKKIVIFYIGGIFNALLGLYVVFEGPSILPPDQVKVLALAFLAFTVINFVMNDLAGRYGSFPSWEESLSSIGDFIFGMALWVAIFGLWEIHWILHCWPLNGHMPPRHLLQVSFAHSQAVLQQVDPRPVASTHFQSLALMRNIARH